MSVWLVLWVVLAGALLFFLVWTLVIITRQKRTWKEFADKNKLRYKPSQLLSPPEISGKIDEHTISIFPSEYVSEDERRSRKLTAIEVQVNSLLPADTGIASGEMVAIIERLGIEGEYRPDHKGWKPDYIAGSTNAAMLEVYFNEKRIEALTGLMKIKNAWVIVVFKGETSLLRIDLPDPLDKKNALDKLVRQMIDVAKVLELESGEFEHLEAIKSKKRQAKSAPTAAEETKVELELEDDDSQEDMTEISDVQEDSNKPTEQNRKVRKSSKVSKK